MSRSFACVLLFFSMLTRGGPHTKPIWAESSPRHLPHANPTVHVLLYNYSSVEAKELGKAERQANAIFQEVGVEIRWVESTLLDRGAGSLTLRDMDVILRLLPQPRPELPGRTALGEALPCGLSREGCIANVFFNRMESLANRTGISMHVILGHSMAHELGHLLLGSNSHSHRGLMRARWNTQDIQRASMHDLLFTVEQKDDIAQRVA